MISCEFWYLLLILLILTLVSLMLLHVHTCEVIQEEEQRRYEQVFADYSYCILFTPTCTAIIVSITLSYSFSE